MKVLCSSCGATLKVPKKSQDEYWQDVPAKSDVVKTDYVAALKDFPGPIRPRRDRPRLDGVGRVLPFLSNHQRPRQPAALRQGLWPK